MTENRKALIEYRLTQARDSIREADVLNQSGMSRRSVMNRLYYAMFYAVLALLQGTARGTARGTLLVIFLLYPSENSGDSLLNSRPRIKNSHPASLNSPGDSARDAACYFSIESIICGD
jgi:uncharacterized protein (UPF0332 family)